MDKQDTPQNDQEKQFLDGMERIERIDANLTKMNEHFQEGLGALAMVRFENPELEVSVSTNGFTVGPAYSLIEQSKEGYKLIKNTKDPNFLKENARLEEELELDRLVDEREDNEEEIDTIQAFKDRVKKQSQNYFEKEKKVDEDDLSVSPEEIFQRFGIQNVPIRLRVVQDHYNKMLDTVIELANEAQSIQKELNKRKEKKK